MSGTDVAALQVVAGEVVEWTDTPPARSPWARQERLGRPHPLARETYDRSLLLETMADLETWLPSLRWLTFTAAAGTALALSAPTWVWWTLIPAAIACVVDWRLPRDTYARGIQVGLGTAPDREADMPCATGSTPPPER